MNVDLGPEAQEYGDLAVRAFGSAGGDVLARRAERDPASRHALVRPVLDQLGALDLDPTGSEEELEAAAALCRAAGWWAVADPIAERLARPRDLDVQGLVAVAGSAPAAPVGDLGGRWATVDLERNRGLAEAGPPTQQVRKGGYVTELVVAPEGGTADPALALTLPCWTLLGMLDRAMALTRSYVRERRQFGQPLASFQGVQFQLTDAEVERAGVEELAKYALWSIRAGGDDALTDALALRLAAIEAAEVVFRTCHQLHGAIGFCDETTLSWLSRASQPLRRLPLGPAATREELARRAIDLGFAGLFR